MPVGVVKVGNYKDRVIKQVNKWRIFIVQVSHHLRKSSIDVRVFFFPGYFGKIG